MRTGWPYDGGTSEIYGRPGELQAERAAGQGQPPFEAPAPSANGRALRARTTRAENLPGEQAVTDQLHSVRYWAGQANVKSCWMCGIRLTADQMLPDGGSACHDLRWYCRDTRACTERWTSHPAWSARKGEGAAGTAETLADEPADTDAVRPVPV